MEYVNCFFPPAALLAMRVLPFSVCDQVWPKPPDLLVNLLALVFVPGCDVYLDHVTLVRWFLRVVSILFPNLNQPGPGQWGDPRLHVVLKKQTSKFAGNLITQYM